MAGKRVVEVTERRTAADFARLLRHLRDVVHPSAAGPVPVTDDPSTRRSGSLYEALPPAAAGRLADRIEWHDTPQHGSWLNMAEVGRGVLARPCLDRRIPDREVLARGVAAWETKPNAAGQFTTADARVKLKRLYPTTQLQ